MLIISKLLIFNQILLLRTSFFTFYGCTLLFYFINFKVAPLAIVLATSNANINILNICSILKPFQGQILIHCWDSILTCDFQLCGEHQKNKPKHRSMNKPEYNTFLKKIQKICTPNLSREKYIAAKLYKKTYKNWLKRFGLSQAETINIYYCIQIRVLYISCWLSQIIEEFRISFTISLEV